MVFFIFKYKKSIKNLKPMIFVYREYEKSKILVLGAQLSPVDPYFRSKSIHH